MRFEGAQNYEDAVGKAADESGIQRNYWDIFHRLHEPTVEVRRQVLESLGWNVQTQENIEEHRGRLFDRKAASILPTTIVVSNSDRFVPVSWEADRESTFTFELRLEDGRTLNASYSTSQLAPIGGSERNGLRWTTYRFPLPPEVPLGYHTLTV